MFLLKQLRIYIKLHDVYCFLLKQFRKLLSYVIVVDLCKYSERLVMSEKSQEQYSIFKEDNSEK